MAYPERTDVTTKPSLRVAVVLGSAVAPRWLEKLVARLLQSDCCEPTLFASESEARPNRSARLFRLYERVDAAVFRKTPDAFALVSLGPPDPQPLDALEECDVVLDFAAADVSALAARARYGAWVLSHRDAEGQPLEPPLFWETYRRDLYRLQLEATLGSGDRRLLYASIGATDPTSLHRARSAAYWKAELAIFNCLAALAKRGQPYMRSRPMLDVPEGEQARVPIAAAVIAHAARAASGVVSRRLRRTVYRDEWFIAARPYIQPATLGEPVSTREHPFTPIAAPCGTSFADPFPFEDGGQTYLFFEQSRTEGGKGEIAYVLLDERAQPVGAPAPALVRPYHLSYPFVFRHEGEVFMIPESSENRTVELYRSTGFPAEWTLEQILFRDVFAVDATLLEDSGRLWLFVTIAEVGASPTDELHLYFSDQLTGPWEPHPANPVISDVRTARPAGRIFNSRGQLVRPAQDSSRAYGFAIAFKRIDVLTPDEYREAEIGRLEPTWLPRLLATHTYNFTDAVEAIDGIRPTLRMPLDRTRRLFSAARGVS